MNLGWIYPLGLSFYRLFHGLERCDGAIDRLSVGKIKTATRRENSEYLHERTSCSLFCLKRERKGERERKRRSSTSKIYFLSRRGSVVGGVAERGRVEEYRGSGQNKVLWEERNKFAWITIKLRESASLIALSLSLSLLGDIVENKNTMRGSFERKTLQPSSIPICKVRLSWKMLFIFLSFLNINNQSFRRFH